MVFEAFGLNSAVSVCSMLQHIKLESPYSSEYYWDSERDGSNAMSMMDLAPVLDLSVKKIRYDSDDAGSETSSMSQDGEPRVECYKKTMMKRYCKSKLLLVI